MSTAATLCPPAEAGSPEWRAALFGQAIAYAAHLTGEICPHALHKHLKSFVGNAEDGGRAERFDAVLMLVDTGLFTVTTKDAETGEATIGEGTMLTVCPMLTAYLYGGTQRFKGESEDEA
jgi:hypothetical protein